MARGNFLRLLYCSKCRMKREPTEVASVTAWYFDVGCA